MSNITLKDLDKKAPKFLDVAVIMRDPVLRSKLTNLIDEAVKCQQKIAMQKETIKQLRETATEEVKINPKMFNAYLNMAFNNDYLVKKASTDEMATLIDELLRTLPDYDSNVA
jgi:formate dehydrogenase maturation protein FdhE